MSMFDRPESIVQGPVAPLFLGETYKTWIRVRTVAFERRLTVNAMLDHYEKLDPITCEAWRQQFGVLAEIHEAQHGI